MSAVVVHDIKNTSDTEFVTEADWIPSFWNFVAGLDRNDLIAELVQNDIDQGATQTVIAFLQDRLVCEGNGARVESDGWRRLRKIQGAGHDVPAKIGKIGVKNHGLKSAFTIGDEITLLSDGQSIIQTLFANGRDEAPYPGASAGPTFAPNAPDAGCRVVIRYRNRDIQPADGEAIVLGAVTAQEIDELFKSACNNSPEQFAGIVSPEVAPNYEILLRHWRLGDARFLFSCTRPRKSVKRIEIFRRECRVSGTVASLPVGLEEQAARRLLPRKTLQRRRVPDFFRRGNRFFVEVSWPVDRRGKPKTGMGKFRYPIGYPENSHQARTGHGAFFNAPIVSDTQRHRPTHNDPTNKVLRAACENLLVDALAHHTIPRWGATGLNPLVPSAGLENVDTAVRPLLATLAKQNRIPTITWREAFERMRKSKRRKGATSVRRGFFRRQSPAAKRYRFVVPSPTWQGETVHSPLSVVSPRAERQIDPRVNPVLIGLFTDGDTEGFCDDFITFDETDALVRALGDGNNYFSASKNLESDLSEPLFAASYLDVVNGAINNGKCDEGRQAALRASLLCPSSSLIATPLSELHVSALVPSGVPGLRVPPLLHQDLKSHPLLRRKKWRRPRYTLATFLQSGDLHNASESTRRLFWKWVRKNERRIGKPERNMLAEIAIWPDRFGKLRLLTDLCEPRSRRIATLLEDSIHRPHEHVRSSVMTVAGRKLRTSIRQVPTLEEVAVWLDTRMSQFVFGEIPNSETVAVLAQFESDVTALLRNPAVAQRLEQVSETLPALALDGSIRRRTELVIPSRGVELLSLSGRFLLKNKRRAATLNKLSPVRSRPTVKMLLATFSEDSQYFGALQARLRQFVTLTKSLEDDRKRLSRMPILPVDGKPRAPCELVFAGRKGDFWGEWKTHIATKGLSQEIQNRYRAVGVTSSVPTGSTSRAFFQWLARQNSEVIERHVNCVLRHVLHKHGPGSWANEFIDTPFIPAKGRSGLRLVSVQSAQYGAVYLPDERKIVEEVLRRDSRVLLAVDRVKEVREPVAERLRWLGVKSLREALGEPVAVVGIDGIEQAPKQFREALGKLRSSRFRATFRKCLDELGVELDLVRNDWHDRLSQITSIRFAAIVEASYRFRGKRYEMEVDAGFDADSGTFWIEKTHAGALRNFYEAIAAQRIFKVAARRLDFLSLERALEIEIHDPSFGPHHSPLASPEEEQGIPGDEARNEDSESKEGDAGPGEAFHGHSPFDPDGTRNVPKPGPIPSKPRTTAKRGGIAEERKNSGESQRKPVSELERQHKEILKREQYASHCQICLCARPPQELAPVGSYVEWEEVRRRIMEAHHVDLKSAGGAEHAGNLILLCRFHHNNYGRRLSRASLVAELRKKTRKKVVRYEGEHGHVTEVKGRTIRIDFPDKGDAVDIFFTNEHATYWLK